MRQGIGSFRRDSNVLFLNLGNTHFVILYRAVVMICALICICYTSIKKLLKGFKKYSYLPFSGRGLFFQFNDNRT